MYNVTATIGPLVGKQVGYSSSVGQCGALASYWLSVLTDKAYQFAYGMSGINAKWVPDSDCATAWNVFTQTNWEAIGFEKIDNPSFSQLKAGDIFFIAASPTLPTGHVGIVASVVNGNITTYEQNIDGIMYVQELPDRNSWSIYGGFSGVIRQKEVQEDNKPELNITEEEDMKFYRLNTNGTILIISAGKAIVVKGDKKDPTNIAWQKLKESKPKVEEINKAQYDAFLAVFK